MPRKDYQERPDFINSNLSKVEFNLVIKGMRKKRRRRKTALKRVGTG